MTNINPNLVDVVLDAETGYSPERQAEDSRDEMMSMCAEAGAVITEFPQHMWIEPKDWADAAADNDRNRTWPLDYVDRFTNQDPTHECTCHALRACFEAAWNRQRRIAVGPPVPKQRLPISAQSASVYVSPLSIYAEANPGKTGGANVRQVLSIAAKRGFLPEPNEIQPRPYGFKHTLHGTTGQGGVNQAKGPWVAVSKFPPNWQETAKFFRPLEYIFPDSYEQTVCLVLRGYGVGVGRNGHSIPYMKWKAAENLMEYTDSYDIFRYDSVSNIKRTVGGSYAIVTTTTPDDWLKPAG